MTNFYAGTANMTICATVEPVESGFRNEDGVMVLNYAVYIVAEEADGTRYRHNRTFMLMQHETFDCGDDEAVCWTQTDAMEKAEKLLAKIKASDRIDLTYWDEIDARYGSNAYVRNGTEFYRAAEERRAA